MTTKKVTAAMREYLAAIGKRGGLQRAKTQTPEQLSAIAAKGGAASKGKPKSKPIVARPAKPRKGAAPRDA